MLSLTLRDYYLRPSPLSLKLPVAFRIGQFLLCNKQVQKSLWPARVRVCRHACRPADRPGPRIGRVSHYSGPGRGRGHVLLTAVAAARRPGPAGPCRLAALFTLRTPHTPSAKSQGPAPLAVAGTSAPQGEMRWGGGRERLFPVDDLVSFHGTNGNRGVFSSPIASPTSASVRLGHGPLCRDEGPSPRSAPRARSSGCPRGPPRAVIFPLSRVSPICKHAAYLPRPDTVLPWLLSPLQAPTRFAVLRSKTPRKGCSESVLTISPPNSDQAFILH